MKTSRIITLVVAVLLSLTSINSYAQMGGGGMRGGRQGGREGMQGPGGQARGLSVDFLKSSGYFVIDSKDALKKIKTDDKKMESAVITAIDKYMVGYDELYISNREDIEFLEDAKDMIAESAGDKTAMRSVMEKVREASSNIRPKMVELHKAMNSSVRSSLEEKALKKWQSFYKSLCEENDFRTKQGSGRTGRGERPEGGERPKDNM